MSTLGRMYAALERATSKIGSASRERLFRRHGLSELPTCIGDPDFQIHGQIELGRRVLISSVPVAAHLVVHRAGALKIGDDVIIGAGCGIASHSLISIGDRTRLGAFVMVLDSDYHVAGKPSERSEATPIHIGQDVSIGSNSTILRGSRIEDSVVIEPGSVVSGLVLAGSHVFGVPARPLRTDPFSSKPLSSEMGVLRVAQRVFRLPRLPAPSDGPPQIARWDSLGSLSFLLALEEKFSITLNPDETNRLRNLQEVVAIVQRTLDRRAARKLDTMFSPIAFQRHAAPG